MAIKTYRPVTSTRRFQTTLVNDDITTRQPYKPLTEPKQRTGGRRNRGDVTIWHRGGGHKRKLRIVDFKRDKAGIPATVLSIEYDPNRSARLALLSYLDGEKRYILQPNGLQVGQKILSGPDADILVGNALPLRNIPPGTMVHNVELRPGKGAQMVRSAGGAAQLVAKEGDYAVVKLPSGETRKILQDCSPGESCASHRKATSPPRSHLLSRPTARRRQRSAPSARPCPAAVRRCAPWCREECCAGAAHCPPEYRHPARSESSVPPASRWA